jgi:hypothetical protein
MPLCYAPCMRKPLPMHPFEENPFFEGLGQWMDLPEGESAIEVSDALWELADTLQLDALKRKIVWPNGKGLSIDQSAERIHKLHPNFSTQSILDFLIPWMEQYAPENYSEKQLVGLDRLTEEWIDEYERRVTAPAKRSRTRHS